MASLQSHRIEPQAVQEIFANDSSRLPKASPLERVGPAKAMGYDHSSSDSLTLDKDKQISTVRLSEDSQATRSARISVSFPTTQRPVSNHDDSVSLSADGSAHREPGKFPSPFNSSADNTFLTAIAAQERRVLELKEEMSHAEAELNKLKKQWAQHEARKKRRNAQSLSTLGSGQLAATTDCSEVDADGSNAWIQMEMEKRKALMNQNRSATRTVFAGSKHTRALSLVSGSQPKEIIQRPQPPGEKSSIPKDGLSGHVHLEQESERSLRQGMPLTRASTTPDLTSVSVESTLNERGIDGDVLIQTGKKMATDLRDGLWTFWEDIRQAAVGDEAASAQPLSTQPSHRTAGRLENRIGKKRPYSWLPANTSSFPAVAGRSSPTGKAKSSARSRNSNGASPSSALADPSFWTEHGFTLHSARTGTPRNPGLEDRVRPVSVVDSRSDEAWDTWDDDSIRNESAKNSPSSSVGSEVNTMPTSASDSASPRLSSEESASRPPSGTISDGPIPWPALSSHPKSTLPRSASRLVSEWEEIDAAKSRQTRP